MSEQIQKVGNYILLEKLASGGMAEVYLAKMISSDKLVAIKKILPNRAETEEYIRLFQEEIKVSLQLKHGNIVNYYDFIIDKDQLYLVMEFVNGMTLRKLLGDMRFRDSKLSLAQSLYIASEVASGLDHAHRTVDSITNKKLNVIHRDINPHNVMIGFDGTVKIIDFGIAKADFRKDLTKVGTIKGKFSYMSPEQAEAKPVDSRSDIYALGIVLWELLTGQKMHDCKNDFESLKKIRATQIRSPRVIDPQIPAEIEKIVLKALEKDPLLRYQKVSDMKFEINQVLSSMFAEFRPADFADFISSIYSELIRSRIEKLSYFARVKFEQGFHSPPAAAERPVLAKEIHVPAAHNSVQLELPDGFESKMASTNKDHLSFDNLKQEKNIFATEVKMHSKQKASQFFSDSKPDEETSLASQDFMALLENSVLWNLKHFALIVIVLYAGFSFYKQFLNPDMSKNIFSIDQSSEAAKTDVDPANEAQPIFISPKEDDFSSKFLKKMRASGRVSYVNISIENSTAADTHIYIDGKVIYDKAPIRKFPIYANKTTTVVAYNPRLKIYDERKLVIQAGRTMSVKLVLKPYHQK